MLRQLREFWITGAFAVCLVGLAAQWVAAEEPAEGLAEERPASVYVVPDGDADELYEFVKQLMIRDWPRREVDVQAAKKALREAADRMLAAEPAEKHVVIAVKTKMFALETQQQYVDFAEQLKKLGHLQHVETVTARAAELGRELRRADIERELQTLAKEWPEDAKERLALTIKKAEKFLADDAPDESDLELMLKAVTLARSKGDLELAIDTCRGFIDILGKGTNEGKFTKTIDDLQGQLDWWSLPGNEMKVEGTLFGGDALDWDSYRGKVVLIDFWATWCGPCRGEIPNMKDNYKRYHEMGFEIIGISLDKDREALETFLEGNEIPWDIVHDENSRNPTAEHYHIHSLPTMVLVDRQGKVISTKARGASLTAELVKIFGQVDLSEEPEE